MAESLHSDDYISISSIKEIFFNIFKFLFKVLDFFINAIRNSFAIFIFSCLVGMAAGYLYYWQTPHYFGTEMIVKPNELTRKAYYEIIRNLNDLIGTQSYANLSSELKVDENLGKQLLYLEAKGLNNETLIDDTVTRIGGPFKIAAKIADSKRVALLQVALVNYLNNNPYLRLTKEGQKKIYLERLQFIDKEQRSLDSLKENYNHSLASAKMPVTFYNNAFNPAEIYVHSSGLALQREDILKWLNNESQAILVIDGFKRQLNPQSVSWKIPVLIGLGIGVLLGMLLAALLAIRRMVNKI